MPLFLWIVFLYSTINTNFLNLWDFGRFGYFSLVSLLRWMNREIHLTRPPFPKQGISSMVSTLRCQICSTLLYWRRHTKFKQENIIVDTVSTNRFPLCGTLLYVNWRKIFKHQNIFVGMVIGFKNKLQCVHSISTLLLTNLWNYCTQSFQYYHALHHDIAIS